MHRPPTILFISHVLPYPPAAGNEIRLLRMVTWLRNQGFSIVMLLNHDQISPQRKLELEAVVDSVHFIGDEYGTLPPVSRARYSAWNDRLARQLPDSFVYTWIFGLNKKKKLLSDDAKRHLASDRLVQVTRHLYGKYNPFAVVAEYVFAAPCLDVVPRGVLKIIDTIDMFSRKKAQVLSYGIDDPLPCSSREERNYLLKSDLIIAIHQHEAQMFRNLVRDREVITVGIDLDVVAEIDNSRIAPGTILIVGSDNPLNQHGLKEFCECAWPAVRTGNADARVRVVGRLASHLQSDDERIQRVGWVPSLDEEYRKAEIVVNPTLAGTGLKIKTVEALCHGKAFVGTPNSVEGLASRGDAPYRVCKDWNSFADTVLVLLKSEAERVRLQQLALQFARENFSTEKVYASLGQRLQEALWLGRDDADSQIPVNQSNA